MHALVMLLVVAAVVLPRLLVSVSGSILPWMDQPTSFLSDLWPERVSDPFRVLEEVPFSADVVGPPIMSAMAKVDWKETPEGHVIRMDVPGLKKEELKIEVEENRVLRVSGERKREEEKKGDHWHRNERCYGKFWRRFRLPENADVDSVKAKLEDGVLSMNMVKLSADKVKGPRTVSVEGGGSGEITKVGDKKQEL